MTGDDPLWPKSADDSLLSVVVCLNLSWLSSLLFREI